MMNVLAQYMPEWVQRIVGWGEEDGYERRLSAEKALSYAPVWNGVSKIAGHIAQLPIGVYKRLDRGAERDRTHNVHRLMRRPNAYQTSSIFREVIATHSLLEGNGRAAIVRNGSMVSELIPLDPNCTTTIMHGGVKVHGTRPPKDDRLRLFFKPVESEKGAEDGLIVLEDAQVLHVLGLSLDGVNGIALRKIAERNIGASINAEKRLANQMENGFAGRLMLHAPKGAFRDSKDAEEFLDKFDKRHNSPEKAGKTGMLREGITAEILASSNKDAEMIENRRFQRQDAALYLGLESILGDDQSVSYNSLEQKNLAYLMNCLNKWLKRWEEEMEYKLLPKRQFESEEYFIRFNTAALLKSDFKSTVESLGSLVTSTIFSRNEARDKLDMNPVEGGDVYENPNTKPGTAAAPAAPEPPAKTTARNAINSRLAHMISVESGKVIDAARQASEKGKNFLQWLDDFYGAKWSSKLADVLEEIGIDREESTAHCAESKRRLIEVCDYSQPENLVENVTKCVSTWENRANSIGVVVNV